MDYKSAGVDVEAGRAFVERIRSSVEATRRPEVVGGLGGFGGMMRLPDGMRQPLLVSGTDGVGTKLELAQEHDGHHDVGIDLVAMCVNDVITSGAAPLFFLDYMATGALSPEAMAQVVEGVAEGCRRSGCALLGGETAEMPGFYPAGRYDLAGFCVAVVEADDVIDGSRIKPGDQVIGVASSGVHSNGYSLVRNVLKAAGADRQTCYGPDQRPLIQDLLQPTQLYPGLVQSLLSHGITIHGMAHITGGGLPENLPRCLPAEVSVRINADSWPRPALFDWLQQAGEIPERDLWHTFNMGIGYCLVVPEPQAELALKHCADSGLQAWRIGSITPRDTPDQPPLQGLPA